MAKRAFPALGSIKLYGKVPWVVLANNRGLSKVQLLNPETREKKWVSLGELSPNNLSFLEAKDILFQTMERWEAHDALQDAEQIARSKPKSAADVTQPSTAPAQA